MTATLTTAFKHDPQVVWTKPGGGFFLWITLPAGIDSEQLFPLALERGVAFVPGAAFSNCNQFRNAARLCFAFPDVPDIQTGVVRLKAATDSLQSREAS
jgi:2-aminoadipate transaminase